MILHETEHLYVDWRDRVWLTRHETEACPVSLGGLCEDLGWPTGLGARPNWWITEIADLYDAWTEGTRFRRDYRDEVDEAFRRKER